MRQLYPEIHPFAEHHLAVTDGHTLYLEESGNPCGIPVLFVHGGPGGGTSGNHRRFFDPERYRIILFDQRGCGKSQPHASLTENTTSHLIADMEAIRRYLNIEQWLLFGGSWGSTLSLVYAETHPERVMALVLRGIFLCRPNDLSWFYQKGASEIFPDYWRDYLKPIPINKHNDLLKAYHSALTSENELLRMSAAKAWSVWEARCSTLDPNPELVHHFEDPHIALAMARIEAHYFINHAFLSENQIIRDADKLKDIPITIVHGRYDMVCPISQAYDLCQALPQAELHIVRDAGHSAFEPGITDNLIRIMDHYSPKSA